MTFEEVRARFPVLERIAYLNAGTFGPLSRRTAEAVAAAQRDELEGGRGGTPYFERLIGLRQSVRGRLALEIGVPAESLALTSSTTAGCNVVLLGLALSPEDEVVTTDCEHFGLIGPLLVSGARIRVAKLRGRPAAEALDAVLAEVGPRTRLVAVSHVTWTTGQVLPIRELREAAGVPVLADGAQGAGAIPVDAAGVDFYTVSGQKWLCGPDATGAVYVRDPELLHLAAPSYFSQASYDLEGLSFEPKAGAARFDPGTVPMPSLAGLDAALDELPDWRFERAAATAARARELLSARYEVVTEPGQAALVSFRPDGDPAELAARAVERGVVIRDLPGTGWLRASIGYWTSEEDLERLLEAIA